MYLSFPVFDSFPDLLCVFTTRIGGFSKEPYDSLNLGLNTGDHKPTVFQNREKLFVSLQIDPDQVAFAGQVHSSIVTVVKHPGIHKNTDALIYQGKQLFLCIQTADCFPIFLYQPIQEIVAVIHAGWRGTHNGIVQNTLQILKNNFNVKLNDFYAAIGPGIQSECFEVKADVYQNVPHRFLKQHRSEKHKNYDLKKHIVYLLENSGIPKQNLFVASECTFCRDDLFYSHRRDGTQSGRMMGIIGLSQQN